MQKRYLQNFAPRWIIFSCDLALITVSFGISFLILHHLSVDMPFVTGFLPALGMNLVIGGVCIVFLAIYKGIIRYSEIKDVIRIIKFGFLQFGLWSAVCLLLPHAPITNFVSAPLLLINLFVVIFLLVSFRLLVKEVYFRATQSKTTGTGCQYQCHASWFY
jgi:FlaA1/EpsC-like NDP-sugar epimerase